MTHMSFTYKGVQLSVSNIRRRNSIEFVLNLLEKVMVENANKYSTIELFCGCQKWLFANGEPRVTVRPAHWWDISTWMDIRYWNNK